MNPIETNPGTQEQLTPTIAAVRQIDALKKNTESLEKTRALFDQKSFGLEITTRLDELHSSPAKEYQKEVYATVLFGQKVLIKNKLFDFLHEKISAGESDPASAAAKFLAAEIGKLEKLDDNKNGKLEYAEILKDEKTKNGVESVLNVSPFFIELRNSKHFDLSRANVEEKIPEKQKFIVDYLKKFAGKMIDRSTGEPVEGGGLRLAEMMHAMTLEIVGGEQLTLAKFDEAWTSAREDVNVEKIYSGGSERADSAKRKFDNLLESDDKKIIDKRVAADERLKKQIEAEITNPHGHFLREVSGMENILVYFGKDALIGTILLNLVLAKFNPAKFLSNPIALGSIATVGLLAKHYSPELLAGKSAVEKLKEDELKKEFQKAPESVQNWLVKFSKNDLYLDVGKKGKVGKLLDEKGRSEISSAELAPLLERDELPENAEILAGTDAARKIFLLFRACQKRDISPLSFFSK